MLNLFWGGILSQKSEISELRGYWTDYKNLALKVGYYLKKWFWEPAYESLFETKCFGSAY